MGNKVENCCFTGRIKDGTDVEKSPKASLDIGPELTASRTESRLSFRDNAPEDPNQLEEYTNKRYKKYLKQNNFIESNVGSMIENDVEEEKDAVNDDIDAIKKYDAIKSSLDNIKIGRKLNSSRSSKSSRSEKSILYS